MTKDTQARASRRAILTGIAATAGAALLPARFAIGQAAKVKVGLMLPYTGTYAALGKNITFRTGTTHAVKISETGGKEKLTASELASLER